MKINYFTHNIELTDDLKSYFEKRISKIEIYSDFINKIDVYFELEKYNNKIEVVIDFRKGKTVYFMSVENDMYKSIDNIIDRIERNLNKYKSKIVHHKEIVSPKYLSFYQKETVSNNEENELERIDMVDLYKKPLSIEDAILQLEYKKNREFIVFYNYDINNEEDFVPTIIFKLKNYKNYIAYEKIDKDNNKIKSYELIGEKYEFEKLNEKIIEIELLDKNKAFDYLNKQEVFVFKDKDSLELFFLYNRDNGKKGIIKIDSFQ